MDVNVRVYAVAPNSRPDQMEQMPSTTPDRFATEWAAYIFNTPTATKPAATATQTFSVPSLAGCPGALPSRLQVGQSGMVSLEPPVANRVRSEPDREAEVLGQMMPGEKFTVLDGTALRGWLDLVAGALARAGTGRLDFGRRCEDLLAAASHDPHADLYPHSRGKRRRAALHLPRVSLAGGLGMEMRMMFGVNEGTLVDGVTFATGMVGQAFSFDGKN